MSQATRALAHALDTGTLAARRAFFLRAEDPPFAEIDAEQSFRPAFRRLKQAVPRLESGGHELGLVLLTKHKEENFANIARGWALLAIAGTLVCAGANDDGAASLEIASPQEHVVAPRRELARRFEPQTSVAARDECHWLLGHSHTFSVVALLGRAHLVRVKGQCSLCQQILLGLLRNPYMPRDPRPLRAPREAQNPSLGFTATGRVPRDGHESNA